MLTDTNISIAYKDDTGQYITKKCTVFELDKNINEISTFDIKVRKYREVIVSVKCPLCSDYHDYSIHIGDIFRRDMIIGGCSVIGVPIFFVGKSTKVNEHVEKVRNLVKKVYGKIGAK